MLHGLEHTVWRGDAALGDVKEEGSSFPGCPQAFSALVWELRGAHMLFQLLSLCVCCFVVIL